MVEYSNDELMNHINQLQTELDITRQNNTGSKPQSMGYNQQYQNSVVEWQLNLDKEFELIHHQIRGHILKRDNDGNEYWTEPDDDDQKLLNEKGAQEVEKIVRNYLNKNLLLSNYSEALIIHRVAQFAHRLRRFIYLNYEEFGLITYYKQKHFEMIVMNIVDMVEAAYYRALVGGERESLTTIRQIVQTESFDNNRPQTPMINQYSGSQRGSRLNPRNWFK